MLRLLQDLIGRIDIGPMLQSVFDVVSRTPYSTICITVGFIFVVISARISFKVLAQSPAETQLWQKLFLFTSLFVGVGFIGWGALVASPRGVAATAQNEPKVGPFAPIEKSDIIKNLEENREVKWLIRLIPYDRNDERNLSAGRVSSLGDDSLKYVFVAPYDELRGQTVADAVRKVGNRLTPDQWVSAIIFRLSKSMIIYPASARGLLQVIKQVEVDDNIDSDMRYVSDSRFRDSDLENLKDINVYTWSWRNYRDLYPRFCRLAIDFKCGNNSAIKNQISSINGDWHPLGFARENKHDICANKNKLCVDADWSELKGEIESDYGVRTFFIKNYKIADLGARYLVDFDKPEKQVIPYFDPND